MSKMAEWVRVKDKRTGHEYSVKNVNEKVHEILDKPAVKANGKPMLAKPHRSLEPANGGDDLSKLTKIELEERAGFEPGSSGLTKADLIADIESSKGVAQ
jgi:hypothetical protein